MVEVGVRDSLALRDERRLLYDFVSWRRGARALEQLSAYRTIERTLTHDGVSVDSLVTAEIMASAFNVARVPPLLGRTLWLSLEPSAVDAASTPAVGLCAARGIRDHVIRGRFPTEEYLAVRLEVDRETGGAEESDAAFTERRERTYDELQRRIAQEAGVVGLTYGDRLPGMEVAVRQAEVELSPGEMPVPTREMWTAAVGSGYFEAFDRPIVSGRQT